VVEVFERNFRDRGELGASISIWWDGVELLNHGHGWCEREQQRPWTTETLVPVYSATKGPAAATLLLALETRGLNEGTPVREVWPKFPVEHAEFRHLLSHQCGLAVLDQRGEILDHASVVSALENQLPAWSIGDGHGYHPRTFGALVDEPVRRLTGRTLGEFWHREIATPLGLEFWIGLPATEWPRVARLYPGKRGNDDLADAFYKHLTASGSFTRRAFSSPHGLYAVQDMNESTAWAAALPSLGGLGTASAIARFYQAAIGAIVSPLSPSIREALKRTQSAADDRVLLRPTVFTCGMQKDPVDSAGVKLRRIFGPSMSAFGHPGAGGSHGMGDPETGVSFAYTMNQMNLGVMPGAKCVEMIDALFSEM